MSQKIKIREIECKSALSKCGFPGGGLAINPYVGCEHGCVYCYARFIKKFTGHTEEWGSFVDARMNITEVLKNQLRSAKYQGRQIYIGTVTDPYQPLEKKYKLTRKMLEVLLDHSNPVSVLTKSDLILRDLDLLKQLPGIEVNFTLNTLNKEWKSLVEPYSSSAENRLKAAKKLSSQGIRVCALMGPYWPIFTDPEALFREFQKAGMSHVFTESVNTIGGNWTGVDKVLKRHYPQYLSKMRETLFRPEKFAEFYTQAESKVRKLSKKYHLPVTIYFARGHAAKNP